MPDTFAFRAYLQQAEDLLCGSINGIDAPQQSPLNENLLEQLGQAAEEAALTNPRRALAIAQVADAAARNADLRLQACAAWNLARAYNHIGQPKLVATTIARARRDFEKLNDLGWLAACDWQLNHLAWARPNFAEAARQLESALRGLEQAELVALLPHCGLALSYAQILCSDFAGAQKSLSRCEKIFIAQSDSLNRARCWLNEASCQRRQRDFDGAYIKLEQALGVFGQHGALLDVARTHYQLGLWHFLSGREYPKAADYLEQAAAVFSSQGMDLWQAVCENGLAQINIQSGSSVLALRQLRHARASFMAHDVPSLTADNLNDSGQLELMLGDLPHSLEHFRQAEALYQSLGFEAAVANVLANRGNAAALSGYFQDALNDLEQAQARFQKLGNPLGVAGCAFYLSQIWTNLNQYPTAHTYLDQAEALFQQSVMLGPVYNQRAQILSLENKFAEAATALDSALEISRASGLAPQIALAGRRLGEMLLNTGEAGRAVAVLTRAESQFQQMDMHIEQAACLASLGACHAQTSATEIAEAAFRAALALCQGTLPEVESRCQAGLAALAEGYGKLPAALGHYRVAVQAIGRLRHSFWQPALAGSYLRSVKATLDQAVQVAASLQAAGDSLAFIEGSKAQTLSRQLSTVVVKPIADVPSELQALQSEIESLQAQIRAIYSPSPWSRTAGDLKTLQGKLIAAAQAYDRRLSELERSSAQSLASSNPAFDLEQFRGMANERLGQPWLALDYYLTGQTIVISAVTPGTLTVYAVNISARLRMALDVCAHSHRGAPELSAGDLQTLGQALLPKEIQKHLSSDDTPLILSPHGELHNVPWAALHPKWTAHHLVETCIPRVVPSLQFLQLLWGRSVLEETSNLTVGLLLGVSDFQGRLPPLPSTLREAQSIARLSHGSQLLLDAQATWGALRQEAAAGGLAAFAFLHLSSHITHDSRTGRLSSLALHDQDVALDRLRELAPLPALVTLSACNGAQSLVYEGDEHVGIAVTCLLIGANTVLGSLWQIADSTADLTGFYRGFLTGLPPAQALAQAQRAAIQDHESVQDWAGFLCMGT